MIKSLEASKRQILRLFVNCQFYNLNMTSNVVFQNGGFSAR